MPRQRRLRRPKRTELPRLMLALGYRNERAMLEEWYERSGLSIRRIGELLGRSYTDVKYRLRINGIPLRGRGGPNHQSPA